MASTFAVSRFPTQGQFCCHIKQQLRNSLYLVLSSQEQPVKRLDSVSRSCVSPSRNSHLILSVMAGKSQTFQFSMALFALTNYHELSNEAVVTVTALLLGIPIMHALYLQDQRPDYADNLVRMCGVIIAFTARYMQLKLGRQHLSFRDYQHSKWI